MTANALRILQITDMHIRSVPGKEFMASPVDTEATLQTVLDEIHANEPADSIVVATGDLVQDPLEASYQRLKLRLGSSPNCYYLLPGNHDDAVLARKILNRDNSWCVGQHAFGDWLMLFLDTSHQHQQPGGMLSKAELSRLERTLAVSGQRHVMLFLHHPPVSIGSRWMDEMGLGNADALFAITDRYPQVKGMVFGHIHQQFEGARKGIRMIGSPSTCVQFKPGTGQFEIDTLPPAYRWFDLRADGTFETGVKYVRAQLQCAV
ncbi:MAG: phosphodiesterase [Chromatiales bacterium]|jgi:Icc protein